MFSELTPQIPLTVTDASELIRFYSFVRLFPLFSVWFHAVD